MSIQPTFWKPGQQQALPPKPDTKPLTVVYVTTREQCMISWALDSLHRQLKPGEQISFIWVTSTMGVIEECVQLSSKWPKIKLMATPPKPNLWQGKFKATKEDWWAKCNALNTAVCLCETEWVAFLDDRSVLVPTWMDAVRDAMRGNYAVCGSYEKREGMEVKDGVITVSGITVAKDNRLQGQMRVPLFAHAGFWYGCTNALPMDWILQINGFPEKCDSVSFEDIITGHLLANNRRPIYYDTRMHIIEDRTQEKLGPTMKRSSKERHPHDKEDKTHKIWEWAKTATRSDNSFDIVEMRKSILAGGNFPMPVMDPPPRDWFDQQLLSEM